MSDGQGLGCCPGSLNTGGRAAEETQNESLDPNSFYLPNISKLTYSSDAREHSEKFVIDLKFKRLDAACCLFANGNTTTSNK